MTIDFPQVPCWNCPEGTHSATCLESRVTSEMKDGKRVDYLLLVFHVHIDTVENIQYLAKRRYELPLKSSSPLVEDLTGWFGHDFLKRNKRFDPASLKGQKATISLVHIHNEGYPKPFVHIKSISAPQDEPECLAHSPGIQVHLD